MLAAWRRDAGLRVAALLPEPEAGLLRGAVLGQQKASDTAMRADFAATGASWVLVVSGMHLSLLLACLYLPLRRLLPPWPSVVITIVLAAAYAAFVGLGVPVMRAALMAALVLLAQALGRPSTALNLLAVAALALTLGDPNVVADAGFQLSFGAVAGILWLAPPLVRRWRRVPVLGELAAVAVAVQVTTWPIVAWQFGQVIPVAVPAGIACGLLLPPILLLGAAQVLAAALWLPLGQVVAWVCWLPLALLAGMLHIAAGLPGAALALPGPGGPMLLGWYALLAGIWVAVRRRRVAAVAAAPL